MPTEPVENQAVSLAEAGRILNYRDPGTLVRLIQTGQLQGFRARTPSGWGAWRVTRASIASFMAGLHAPDSSHATTGYGTQGAALAPPQGSAGPSPTDTSIQRDSPPGIKSLPNNDLQSKKRIPDALS